MENRINRLYRTSPSLHLVGIIIILAIAVVGYSAVILSAGVRGYEPSKIVAARDLFFFIPILAFFFWLTRRQRYKGEMMLLTAAVFLFSTGLIMQYRLFSDPEYGARGAARQRAREAKAQ